jgi:hypothetical protein
MYSEPNEVTFFCDIYHEDMKEEEERELNEIRQKLYIYGNQGILERCILKVENRQFSVGLFNRKFRIYKCLVPKEK